MTGAIAAWKEALRRSPDDQILYLQMLDKSVPFHEVHLAIVRLGDEHLDRAFTALQSGYFDNTTLDSIESKRSELTFEQQSVFDRAKSRRAAAEKDYRLAYELGMKTLGKVTFPAPGHMSEIQYRLSLVQDPTNFGALYNLCLILRAQERKREMLQVLESVTKQAGCPDYFYAMKGDLLASMDDWSGAWGAISRLVRWPLITGLQRFHKLADFKKPSGRPIEFLPRFFRIAKSMHNSKPAKRLQLQQKK